MPKVRTTFKQSVLPKIWTDADVINWLKRNSLDTINPANYNKNFVQALSVYMIKKMGVVLSAARNVQKLKQKFVIEEYRPEGIETPEGFKKLEEIAKANFEKLVKSDSFPGSVRYDSFSSVVDGFLDMSQRLDPIFSRQDGSAQQPPALKRAIEIITANPEVGNIWNLINVVRYQSLDPILGLVSDLEFNEIGRQDRIRWQQNNNANDFYNEEDDEEPIFLERADGTFWKPTVKKEAESDSETDLDE